VSRRILAFLFAVVTVLVSGCATLVPTPLGPATEGSPAAAMAAWARVLDRYVDDRGEVDFPALADDRIDLDRYVRFVADTSLDSFQDDNAKLAHLINAYNALSMYNVIESGIPKTHAGLNKVTFFFTRKLVIGGHAMSLYAFENDVIRPFANQRHDPRIHFALNCSALSCPVLPRRPFTAEHIDAELERGTTDFFRRPENYRIDEAAHTVWLSEILSFYTSDFVSNGTPGLIAYVDRYVSQPAPLGDRVRFTPYDWTIANSRRSP